MAVAEVSNTAAELSAWPPVSEPEVPGSNIRTALWIASYRCRDLDFKNTVLKGLIEPLISVDISNIISLPGVRICPSNEAFTSKKRRKCAYRTIVAITWSALRLSLAQLQQKGLVSAIRSRKEPNAGSGAASPYFAAASDSKNGKGKLRKRNESSAIVSLLKSDAAYHEAATIGTEQKLEPEPMKYYNQGHNLGSVLLASFTKRSVDSRRSPGAAQLGANVSDPRSDHAGSSQSLLGPPVAGDKHPIVSPKIQTNIEDGKSANAEAEGMIDHDLVSVIEQWGGMAFYMAADESADCRHAPEGSRNKPDVLELSRRDGLTSLSSVSMTKPRLRQPSSRMFSKMQPNITIERGMDDAENVAQLESFADSSVSDQFGDLLSMQAHSTLPYAANKLPAIRDLDWSKVDPADFEQVANAYNDISPADSAVMFSEPAMMLLRNYNGKGKGRAVDERWHAGDPIIFAPRPQFHFPKLAHHRPYVGKHRVSEFGKQISEALEARKSKKEKSEDPAKVHEELGDLEEAYAAGEVAKLQDCNICGDGKWPFEFPIKAPSSKCHHEPTTCIECLESWMAAEVETKGSNGLKCPECPAVLQYEDIQRAASSSAFDTYERLLTRSALAALGDFAWCLNPKCGSGQENPENNNYMACAACGYKQCLTHRCEWHSNETCAQYEYRTSGQAARDEEAKTEAMLDDISKKCPGPGCGWRIQKISGCDHMTCKRCGFQFCWQCLASHEKIRKDGNAVHQTWCKFHSDNLAVAWPFNAHQ
nr:e3 ubiquitin-protein ligase rnf19a [Quercus suber]